MSEEVIIWKCQGCHQEFDERKYFQWKSNCVCGAWRMQNNQHSQRCYEEDLINRRNELYYFVKDHIKECSTLKSLSPNYSLCPDCFISCDFSFTCDCGKKIKEVNNNQPVDPRELEQNFGSGGLISLIQKSQNLTELEKNWGFVKNSSLYEGDKEKFDKTYSIFKEYLSNREREREREQSSERFPCPHCHKFVDKIVSVSLEDRHLSNGYISLCQTCYDQLVTQIKTNPLSRFRRGGCRLCLRSNVLLLDPDTNLCFDCGLKNIRSEIQDIIRKQGLEQARIEWENDKRVFEEWKRQEPSITDKIEELIQAVEDDLYPGRRSKRNWLIGGAIVLVIVAIGLGIWFWRRKKKSNF